MNSKLELIKSKVMKVRVGLTRTDSKKTLQSQYMMGELNDSVELV